MPEAGRRDVYIEKLGHIFANSALTVLPIVDGVSPAAAALTQIIKQAQAISGANIPVTEVTVGISGDIIGERASRYRGLV